MRAIAGYFAAQLVLLASRPSHIADAKWLAEQWRCGGIRHKVAYELAFAARMPSASGKRSPKTILKAAPQCCQINFR
jgi:hypothetical protein